MRMDDIDRALLATLSERGRASWADLARRVGLSAPTVQERVRRLEDRGVISGYRAVVAPEAVGLGVAALVDIVQSDDSDQEEVAEQLAAVPEVEDCWFVAGDESFVVKVRVAEVAALEQTLRVLRGLPGVARTRTTVVLSTRWEGRTPPLPPVSG